MILPGMALNGSVLLMACDRSLKTRICRSTSGTCSLAAFVLRFSSGKSDLRHSNYLSINAVSMVKPRFVFKLITFLIALTS
jgi:hypothetical protein